jgi:FKBP-type peptidyl-prolyl cis-trans isomerase SlpA
MQIENGSTVSLHYSLRLAADGRVVDTTRDTGPVRLVVGQSDLLSAFERCLLGLVPGDVRRFEIASRDAYGEHDIPEIQFMPRSDFPIDMSLEPGIVVAFDLPSGDEVPGTVVEVSEHEVQVDFSHPLAGHDLVFEVEILEVAAPAG